MKTRYKMILQSLLPAILFLILYKLTSFKHAVIVGFSVGIVIYLGKYIHYKKLSSFDYLGIFGLITQTIIGILAKNPKMYFIYPLIENCMYSLAFGISLIRNKDIISYLAKDLTESEDDYQKLKPAFRRTTYLWTLFFIIKVIIKLAGLSSWSFEVLYIVNWLFGLPVSLFLLWFSFAYPEKYYEKTYCDMTEKK